MHWAYYDLIRRVGIFLLLGLGLGAIAGFGYHTLEDPRQEFEATGTAHLGEVRIFFDSGPKSTRIDAVESVKKSALLIQEVSQAPLDRMKISSQKRGYRPIWKSMAMGSIIGGLFCVGLVYLHYDIRTYLQHRRQIESGDS